MFSKFISGLAETFGIQHNEDAILTTQTQQTTDQINTQDLIDQFQTPDQKQLRLIKHKIEEQKQSQKSLRSMKQRASNSPGQREKSVYQQKQKFNQCSSSKIDASLEAQPINAIQMLKHQQNNGFIAQYILAKRVRFNINLIKLTGLMKISSQESLQTKCLSPRSSTMKINPLVTQSCKKLPNTVYVPSRNLDQVDEVSINSGEDDIPLESLQIVDKRQARVTNTEKVLHKKRPQDIEKEDFFKKLLKNKESQIEEVNLFKIAEQVNFKGFFIKYA